MEGGSENRVALKPVSFKENGNRRALKDIKNLTGVAPHQCVASKNGALAHRPITRKYAAILLANKSNSCDEKEKQKKASMEKENTIDVDIPMVEEPQQMEEHEPTKELDIDSLDLKNPLAVVEYIEDIYNYYRKIEPKGQVNPDYMSVQFDINEKMRAILVDWLIEVHYKFRLMDETLYLTINIIDRFLSNQTVVVVRNKLQLVGVTGLFLAWKYEELSVPLINNMIQLTASTYTREEILCMERGMLKTLKFEMSMPTPCVFMRRFLKAAESDRELELLAFYIIELCLVEYEMVKYKPSMLAASAVFTAQCSLKGFKVWSKTCEIYTGYNENQLMECSKMMVDFHRKSGTGKLTAVHKKYTTLKFGCVAKCVPALFLLDDNDSNLNQ